MTAAKFSAGQSVLFQVPSISRKHDQNGYRVVRVMPLDGDEYEYRIKSPAELYERVVKESQLALVRDDGALERDLKTRRTLGEAPQHRLKPRLITALVASACKKRSSLQQARTEPHMGASDAAWLDDWCAQKMITAPDDRGAGVQTLVQECEATARADGVSLRRALNLEGYSNLQDYFLDALDERAEADSARLAGQAD